MRVPPPVLALPLASPFLLSTPAILPAVVLASFWGAVPFSIRVPPPVLALPLALASLFLLSILTLFALAAAASFDGEALFSMRVPPPVLLVPVSLLLLSISTALTTVAMASVCGVAAFSMRLPPPVLPESPSALMSARAAIRAPPEVLLLLTSVSMSPSFVRGKMSAVRKACTEGPRSSACSRCEALFRDAVMKRSASSSSTPSLVLLRANMS